MTATVVAAPLQAGAERRADPAAPHDHDVHALSSAGRSRRIASCSVPRAGRPARAPHEPRRASTAGSRDAPYRLIMCRLASARVQARRRGEAAPGRSPVPQRPARAHPAAEADRASGLRLGRHVVAWPTRRRRSSSPCRWPGWRRTRLAVDRARGRRRAAHGGHAATGRTCTPTRPAAATTRSRRSTSGRHAGLDRRQRAAGRLHADRRGVDLGGGGEHRRAGPARRRAQGAVRRRGDRPAHRGQPARDPGVGRGLRGPGLRVHGRHRDDGDRGLARVLLLGDEVQRRRARTCTCSPRATALPAWRWSSCVLRSFTQGAAALTGVEAISNGVPAFRKPKSKNAATTLLLLGLLSVIDVHGADRAGPAHRREDRRGPGHCSSPTRRRATSSRRWSPSSPTRCSPSSGSGFYFVIIITALILVLAANTAFNGFPVLGSILAQDRYLPRQLHTRGDRLALLQRHRLPGRVRGRAGDRLPGRGHPADPALHRRRVRLVHAQPDGHGPALAPAPGHRDRPRGAAPDAPRAADQRRSAR